MAITKNITFPESLHDKALRLMEEEDFDNFSGYLQQLVRDRWEARHGVDSTTQQKPDTEFVDDSAGKLNKVSQAQKDELARVQRDNDEKRARRGLPKRG
jgi:hypothetical protein